MVRKFFRFSSEHIPYQNKFSKEKHGLMVHCGFMCEVRVIFWSTCPGSVDFQEVMRGFPHGVGHYPIFMELL